MRSFGIITRREHPLSPGAEDPQRSAAAILRKDTQREKAVASVISPSKHRAFFDISCLSIL